MEGSIYGKLFPDESIHREFFFFWLGVVQHPCIGDREYARAKKRLQIKEGALWIESSLGFHLGSDLDSGLYSDGECSLVFRDFESLSEPM